MYIFPDIFKSVCAQAYGEESCEVLASIQEFIFSLELGYLKRAKK